MSLAGEHQLQNAATALTAIFALRDTGALLQATSTTVLKGLEEASLPGRFQVCSNQAMSLANDKSNANCKGFHLLDRIDAWHKLSMMATLTPCKF